jgi:hypothetical protein
MPILILFYSNLFSEAVMHKLNKILLVCFFSLSISDSYATSGMLKLQLGLVIPFVLSISDINRISLQLQSTITELMPILSSHLTEQVQSVLTQPDQENHILTISQTIPVDISPEDELTQDQVSAIASGHTEANENMAVALEIPFMLIPMHASGHQDCHSLAIKPDTINEQVSMQLRAFISQ